MEDTCEFCDGLEDDVGPFHTFHGMTLCDNCKINAEDSWYDEN